MTEDKDTVGVQWHVDEKSEVASLKLEIQNLKFYIKSLIDQQKEDVLKSVNALIQEESKRTYSNFVELAVCVHASGEYAECTRCPFAAKRKWR